MPTITQLEYAVAVEKYRHFGRAAEASHVSQPTLSQQLLKLEDEVGIVLFDRIQKPVIPTAEGRRFLDQARLVLREHQKLMHLSRQGKEGEVAGEFRLAIIPTIASYLLPRFVANFSRSFPAVDLFIEELKTEAIIDHLRQDLIDGAILATPIEGLNLKIHPLYYEPFLMYLSKDHPLTRRKQITHEELDGSQMWLLQDGHCFKNQVLNFCSLPKEQGTLFRNIHFESGSLDTLKRLVQENSGYTMVPMLMAESLSQEEAKAHLRPFKTPIPCREVSFVYRRDHWKLEIVRAIEKAVQASLPDSIERQRSKAIEVLDVDR